ncbi:MAG TPA: PEGA domain-containing protein [Myxococcota bacterium]|nr:PEGA domain-containing protein [Myxococcota bacterium]HRY93660.1 PEGA domain-containing protein [Myxococcota bacterium]HSA20993.1 PEGA domain-containing protein [Myxococcota bacterium]
MRLQPCLAALLLLAASAALAQERPIVAVFDLEVKGTTLDVGAVDRLTDYLGTLLAGRGYRVVPRSQLRGRLTEEKKGSFKECYDQGCQIEIGKELAAQKSLSSQVLKIGSSCKVAVNLYDLRTAASDGAGSATGKCDEDGVVGALEQAVEALLGKAVPVAGQPGPPAAKVPDVSEYERLAAQAKADEAGRLEAHRRAEAERAQRLAALEKAWDAVEQVASSRGMTTQARAGVVRKFLQDFPADNPREAEARALVARLDRGEEPASAGGRIKVVSNVPESQVFLDGARIGTTPLEREVPAGEHYVAVQNRGYARFEQKLAIEGGQVVTVAATLVASGQLRITSNPPGMEVLLDGVRLGTTPIAVEAAAGEHILMVKGTGYHEFRRAIEIVAGQALAMDVKLERR